jgi:hypothetical protein
LTGTESMVRQWGLDEDVCKAALFHSIYGTNAFGRCCLDLSQRGELQVLIGRDAEKLVYLFHVSDRPQAWLNALHAGGVISRLDGQFLRLDEAVLAKLIAIECANLIEQGARPGFFGRLETALQLCDVALPPVLLKVIGERASA